MSRKGRAAAPAIFAAKLKCGAASRPFRDTRPLLQRPRDTAYQSSRKRLSKYRSSPLNGSSKRRLCANNFSGRW
ncbi:hypothetical protein D3C76_1810280 [compost metagenome]